MNIHEYQAKEILKEFGAPVSKGIVIFNLDELKKVAIIARIGTDGLLPFLYKLNEAGFLLKKGGQLWQLA